MAITLWDDDEMLGNKTEPEARVTCRYCGSDEFRLEPSGPSNTETTAICLDCEFRFALRETVSYDTREVSSGD